MEIVHNNSMLTMILLQKLKSGSGNPGSLGGRETVSTNLIKGKGIHDIQKQKCTGFPHLLALVCLIR